MSQSASSFCICRLNGLFGTKALFALARKMRASKQRAGACSAKLPGKIWLNRLSGSVAAVIDASKPMAPSVPQIPEDRHARG